jgi:hypothetical protein
LHAAFSQPFLPPRKLHDSTSGVVRPIAQPHQIEFDEPEDEFNLDEEDVSKKPES